MKEPARILVVDDERSLREFLEIFFRREGFSVTTAASADEALIAIDADDFDVVVSDVQLGRTSGLELLRSVKDAAPDTVVIMITAFATTKTNVLVSGESGTGKELVARGIHDLSERREKPFVAVNCGAIPENLLESELFGHVRGAFTGAVSNKPGLVETADGGTLFLDEIGELPQSLQVKLLRLIQEKTLRRVGGNHDQRIDVRIVAATNRDLRAEAEAGRFREDLYYRLNVIQIGLPALRERMEDIPLLVQHFLEKYRRELGKEVQGLTTAAMEKVLAYPFPGNVRELENLIERAVALARGPVLDVDGLPSSVLERSAKARTPSPVAAAAGANLDEILASYERGLLSDALQRAGGVKKRAARLLGISFRSFRYRLEKLGLDDPGTGEDEE